MRENKYDNENFFAKYAQMSRSKEGLAGAGEWDTLKGMLPNFEGKTVLDIGCGYGWHANYAVQHGAQRVVATDISHKMVDKARQINANDKIEYRVEAFEDSVFGDNEFDVVICSLVIHYLASYDDFVAKVGRWLRGGGILAFTVEHPVFTAYGTQDWYYGGDGQKLHFPIDNYFDEGNRRATFLEDTVIKYHRTLTTYLDTLTSFGFRLQRVVEPMPSAEMLQNVPEMADELRRPMMLIVIASKE